MQNRPVGILILLSFTAAMFCNCSVSHKITESNYHLQETPPNGVKVTDHLFCDRTEIDNSSWLEYVYWMKLVFGEHSPEYLSILPDTMVWTGELICLGSLTELYIRHPAYSNFPVLGISQKQAISYSKWRSDRVFEMLLLRLNKIERDTVLNRENYFSIERYYNGTYRKIAPGEKLQYYPHYRLPDTAEWKQILQYADSVDRSYFEKCNSAYCKNCKANAPKFHSDIKPCNYGALNVAPTIHTGKNCGSKKGKPIYNLRGNVREWSAEEDVSLGGGWYDTRDRILMTDTFHTNGQNAWTGFRNVCEWILWKGE